MVSNVSERLNAKMVQEPDRSLPDLQKTAKIKLEGSIGNIGYMVGVGKACVGNTHGDTNYCGGNNTDQDGSLTFRIIRTAMMARPMSAS